MQEEQKITEERIAFLEQEVYQLKSRINQLEQRTEQSVIKGDMEKEEKDNGFIQYKKPVYPDTVSGLERMTENETQSLSERKRMDDASIWGNQEEEVAQSDAEQNNFQEEPLYKHDNKSLDMEQRIGKNIIGIVASVLIFIGLILFASLIYKNLSELGKAGILFGVSGLLLASGMLLHRKQENTFSLSIIGCGMGAIYVSLIVSSVYLYLFSDIVLYVFILIWLAGTAFLCRKYESKVLFIIGQCGIIIASIFSMRSVTEEPMKHFLVVMFFILTTAFYLRGCNMHKSRSMTNIMYISTMLCLVILCCFNFVFWQFSGAFGSDNKGIPCGANVIFLALYAFVLFVLYLEKVEKGGMLEQIVAVAYGVVLNIVLACGITIAVVLAVPNMEYHNLCSGFLYLLFGYVIVGFVEKILSEDYKVVKVLLVLMQVFTMMYCIIQLLHVGNYAGLMLLIVPATVYGYYKNKGFYKLLGLALLGAQGVYWSELYPLHMSVMLLGILAYAYLIKKEKEYDVTYKLALYVVSIVSSFCFAEEVKQSIEFITGSSLSTVYIWCVLVGGINLLAIKSRFVYDWKEDREESLYLIMRVVNAIALVTSMGVLTTDLNVFLYIMLLCLACVLCLLGVKEILERFREENFVGFYVGIKITVFLVWVLSTMHVENSMLISVALFIIAVLSILFGFKMSTKPLRIYGLFLTMISVVKLIMFDIQYTDTIESVLGFIGCGILCFAINWIYNSLSKKWEE